MVHICFNQVIAWFTQFGMGIRHRVAESVRSGKIAVELTRPMDFFFYKIAFELGSQLYGLLFRGVPVGLGLALFVGMCLPASPVVWFFTLTELAVGGYVGLTLGYLVGVSSFWTTEIRTASWAVYSAQTLLGGISMPSRCCLAASSSWPRLLPSLTWRTSRHEFTLACRGRCRSSQAWAGPSPSRSSPGRSPGGRAGVWRCREDDRWLVPAPPHRRQGILGARVSEPSGADAVQARFYREHPHPGDHGSR